jgi:hypothetical protein
MFKLDKSRNEKDKLIELITRGLTKKTFELEAIIGNGNVYSLNTKEDFVNIIKRLKGKQPYPKYEAHDNLVIFLNDPKYNKEISRIIVKGNAINQYCNQESIVNVLSSVDFESKTRVKKDDTIDIRNYGTKFNLKDEKKLQKEGPLIRELLRDWSNLKKAFRLKKTFTFTHDDGDFKIDLSIVSQSFSKETVSTVLDRNLEYKVIKPKSAENQKFDEWWGDISKKLDNVVELQDSNRYYRTIKESRVLENTNYRYEFEVEWLGNKNPPVLSNPGKKREYINNVIQKFLLQITYIKQAIGSSFFIISKNETAEILKSAEKLAQCGFTNEGSLRYFPLAMSLERKNMAEYSISEYSNMIGNIRQNYLVTDKADGLRNLLYINNEGLAYFISRINKIAYCGFKFPDYANSILDGEYITSDEVGNSSQLYAIFDAYIIKGQNLTNNPFGIAKDVNGRHIHIVQFANHFNKVKSNSVIYEDIKYKVKVFAKQYYAGDIWKVGGKEPKKDTTIFTACEKILKKMNAKYGGLLTEGHNFPYKTDGIIFLPVHNGVKQDVVGVNVTNTSGSLNGRWMSNLKWKPSVENTIDLVVKFKREVGNSQRFESEYNNDNKYYIATLYSKIYKSNKTHEFENILSYRLLNEGDTFANLPEDIPFVPIHPFNGKYDSNGALVDTTSTIKLLTLNDIMKCKNGDIIEDGNVVELGYDKSLSIDGDDSFCWVPHRIRKNANAINTAFQIWDLINNPISTDMITGKESVGDAGIYYKGDRNYITSPFNNFNNFVKGQIIDKALANKSNPRVMDLAFGKFGDMRKYIRNRISAFVGIDISPDNLLNKNNGAAVRMLENSRKNDAFASSIRKLIPKTMFIIGDATKNLASSEAGSDMLSKYYLDVLYGHQKPTHKGKLQALYGSALAQYHLLVCNFSIHYMMNSEEQFHSFLLNIKQNLKDQCYFIGTCYDGPSLVAKTQSEGTDGKLVRKIDDTMIYSMEIDEDTMEDFSGFGKKVKFGFETFYKTSDENLVDLEFLKTEAIKFNLKLVDSKLFTEEPDNMFQQFMKSRADLHSEIEDEPIFMELINMERWFIFQKVDDLVEEDDD